MSPSAAPARRTLVLVRHGEAAAYAADDRDRELTPRGRRAVAEAGRWLREKDLVPTHALVSPAARTRGTWEVLAQEWAPGAEVLVERPDGLYSGSPVAVLDLLHEVAAEAEVVVVVGHNPTAAMLALLLDDGDGDRAAFERLSGGFPTAAVAVYDVGSPWAELDSGGARLVDVRPGATGS